MRDKIRLAEEYDAAQDRGEVKAKPGPNTSSPEVIATAADIGLTHKEIHEARHARDAEKVDPGVTACTAEDIIEIGKDLIAVKARLPHGQFLPWIEAEFGMHRMTASRFMQVAEQYGDKSNIVLHLDPTALYELAAPKTPLEVREEVEKIIEAGAAITSAAPATLGGQSMSRFMPRRVAAPQSEPLKIKDCQSQHERDMEAGKSRLSP